MWRWLLRKLRQIRGFFEGFLLGDRGWGFVRLVMVGLCALLFLYASASVWEREAINMMILRWELTSPLLRLLPRLFLFFMAPLLNLHTLRYLLVPLAAFVGAIFLGARYVQDIYELKRYRLGLQYILASLFGIFYPRLIISGGVKKIEPGEENLLDQIGGPGYVIIRPGNVVLFERLNNPSNVRAAGFHFIGRFEMIKEIVNLEDQHGHIDRLRAVTKDGLVVLTKDIQYRFRLWSDRRYSVEAGRSPKRPYPYSVQAVRNMAYNRSVRGTELTSWADAVRIIFEGEIQNYIRQHTIDQVTAPRADGNDPRGDIHRLYQSARFRQAFKAIGAQLGWYGIGHFEVENPLVNDQRVSTWQAGWRGDASVIRAYSEAVTESYKEQGRAEAQAEILLSLVHAVQEIQGSEQAQGEHLQDVFLTRMTQLLEAMNEGEGIEPGGV